MQIRELQIKNFRGLTNVTFDFDKSTNVIVGPNAIGKTTVLEAIRLVKALLLPRYYQEAQQVLTSLGAASPHPQLSNYLDYPSLSNDPNKPIIISMAIELSETEIKFIKSSANQITFEILRGQLARSDEQGQFALTQYLSTDDGKKRLESTRIEVTNRIERLEPPFRIPLTLTIDGAQGQIGGANIFDQTLISTLEKKLPPQLALFSYFPADRAFPSGEVNIQIGSVEANNQIQAHIGNAASKYQRLKQTIVNNLLISELDQEKLRQDFELVFENLLPGKSLAGLSVTQVGKLKVAIKEESSGKIFDLDNMSSGEKGLILTFLLLRRSLSEGGIALLDEPELHLNPAVCKNIIPFLNDFVSSDNKTQILLCTHSAEILGSAFDHPECSIHHLRSHQDATKIYERDNREVFEALRRLGTTAAESLFSRGNIFVEGEHDSAILEDGFFEQVTGYKITSLGGRKEVEKEIRALQNGERKGEIDKTHCFIYDMDRAPENFESTKYVKILQWDRYCLENYLINRKLLFDVLTEASVRDLGSRGTFEHNIIELALKQLTAVVAKKIYTELKPEGPGLRSSDVSHKTYEEIADILSRRLEGIKAELNDFEEHSWKTNFISKCDALHQEMKTQWDEEWQRLCSGKQLIDDLYRDYTINISKFELKRRLVRAMKANQTDDWTLVRSKIRDALHEP